MCQTQMSLFSSGVRVAMLLCTLCVTCLRVHLMRCLNTDLVTARDYRYSIFSLLVCAFRLYITTDTKGGLRLTTGEQEDTAV